ncbi:Ca2+-transporting ATPase [Gillisia sp. Hel_I_86]|uniref:cation-translocating P-type ATPase n=1 Tax=Gillisia sp. Hel_I_86 TaxID=1249981 RepID=UPI001199E11C|nr:cation-transporting P-type ATPase [Gillisia sp. Hel_I_86]TVZ27575.1 Ca2+-transporting ATPase [Gillisia sp. Hel_I_86]
MGNAYTLTVESLLKQLEVDPLEGLSEKEVEDRTKKYGANIFKVKKAKSWALILLNQFLNPIVYILVAATILAFLFQDWLEGIAVIIVILLNAVIGFTMELKATRMIESLQKSAQLLSTVLRNGKVHSIAAANLVPGDVLILSPGTIVGADARIIHQEGIAVTESALTGESDQVTKSEKALEVDTPVYKRSNMVFKGTIINKGHAKAIVTATGSQTELGSINKLVQEAIKEDTPLGKRLNRLSHRLIFLTIFLIMIIIIIGYIEGEDWEILIKTSIALAVAAIPEGLPIVATITLAHGMVKLSKQRVIIKRLEAVQTLGEITMMCTDKTGTLTLDKMNVAQVVLEDKTIMASSLNPNRDGESSKNSGLSFLKFIEVSILCNNALVQDENSSGDSLEIALIVFAEELGHNARDFKSKYPKVHEIPFDENDKFMATLNKYGDTFQICVKGALEIVLNRCSSGLDEDGDKIQLDRGKWLQASEEIASRGLRVLGFAYKETEKTTIEGQIHDLIFIGIVGFLDPPRSDVRQAIETYKKAGIKVTMITGDQLATAQKIAEEINLLVPGEDNEKKVIHGDMIKDLDSADLDFKNKLLHANVFARIIPEQKLQLVAFFQKNNHVVGMMGDGINDTPALRKADIGIAMGIRGTDAAKEVADVILLDDKFASTELTIRQGRTIFRNIRQFVVYLLSCNLAEILSVVIAALINIPLPLLPLQILYLNLVTDTFPALALGMGKGEKVIMERPPRNPQEQIITPLLWRSVIVYGLCVTFIVTGVTLYTHFVLKLPSSVVNNISFYTLVWTQLLHVFNIPSRIHSFFNNEVVHNKWVWAAMVLSVLLVVIAYLIPAVREALSLLPLTIEQYLIVFFAGISSVVIIQVFKRIGITE